MGSRAGISNKNKKFLLNRLKDMLGDDFDPVVKMAEMAVNVHKNALASGEIQDQKEAVACWDKVSQYVEPKLKATEISTVDSDGEVTGFKIEVVSAKDNPAN